MPGCDGRRILPAARRSAFNSDHQETIVSRYRTLACRNCVGRSAVARISSNQPSFLLTPHQMSQFHFPTGQQWG